MKSRIFLVFVLVLCSLLVIGAGCNSSNSGNGASGGAGGGSTGGAGGSSGGASTHSVSIQNFAFNPSTLTIKIGDTVTWTNSDSSTHTVTSDSGNELAGQLNSGQTFSHTFMAAGTFAYHCSIHTSMHGIIIVQ